MFLTHAMQIAQVMQAGGAILNQNLIKQPWELSVSEPEPVPLTLKVVLQ